MSGGRRRGASTDIHVDAGEGKGLVVRRLVRRVAVELAQSPVELDREERHLRVVETPQRGLVRLLHHGGFDEQLDWLHRSLESP